MILSSADILRILGGNEIIRLSANLSITDGKPGLSGREGIYIYVERFPVAQEFEATWTLYIESDEETDLVLAEIRRLLPKVEVKPGLLTIITTTDFRSESTQTAPAAPTVKTAQVDLTQYEERFQGLVEDVQDQMLLVSSGRNGKDGQDGRDGVDGRDGRDIEATQTELFDLKDVSGSPIPLEKGQVLTWDGSKWTNLYVRQTTTYVNGSGGSGSGGGAGNGQINSDTITSDTAPTVREDGKGALRDGDTWWKSDTGQFFVYYADGDSGQWVEIETGEGGGGIPEAPVDGQQYARQDATWTVVQPGGGGGGIEEAPMDGNFYVRQNAQWINLKDALSQLGVPVDEPIDGGNFTTGFSAASSNTPADGGNFTTGASSAQNTKNLDGGNYTTGQTDAGDFSTFGL